MVTFKELYNSIIKEETGKYDMSTFGRQEYKGYVFDHVVEDQGDRVFNMYSVKDPDGNDVDFKSINVKLPSRDGDQEVAFEMVMELIDRGII
jgi:hypothetical protein